ncbi:MAG: hypothetical protein MJ232_03765 [archaeon]|nr:hypothetical protein [archaeon]
MSSKPILVIKDTSSTIGIRVRVGEIFSEHEIQLSIMLAYYWDNNLNVIENLIDLFETVVKRTINEVIPHKNLYLKYNLFMDEDIENATMFEIQLIEVKADDIELRLDGKILSLKNLESQGSYENNSVNEEYFKIEKLIEKIIPTQEKMSFKDFVKMQKENK